MNDERRLIACKTLEPELMFLMGKRDTPVPVIWVDAGKHAWADQLRILIQDELEKLPASCKTVLLGFGFCGNALVGVKSGSRTLILPKASDCFPLFLGSQAERAALGTRTYFFTEGYLRGGGSIYTDVQRAMEQYDEETAVEMLDMLLEHYEKFTVIDTGAFDMDALTEVVKTFATLVDKPVTQVKGNLRMLEALLSGPWPEEDFFIFPPGTEIPLSASLALNTE
jgi:hypothetical protein